MNKSWIFIIIIFVCILMIYKYCICSNEIKDTNESFIINSPTIGIAELLRAIGATKPIGYVDWIGATGATGPTGLQGTKGDTGGTGPTGMTGPRGLSGAVGAVGAKGDTGATGPTGAQGLAGPVGVEGATGPTGARGAQGLAGVAGARGDTGATGPTGAQGLAGIAGAVGARGDTGATGPTGAQGLAGVAGAVGARGDTGATGPTGAQGLAGARGDTGPTGSVGSTGGTGPTGPTGLQGLQGQSYLAQADGYTGNIVIFDSNSTINPPPIIVVGNIENGLAVANGNVVKVTGTLKIDATANIEGYVLLPLPSFNILSDNGLSGVATTKFAYFNAQSGGIYYDSVLLPNYVVVSLNVKADNNVYNGNKYYTFEYTYFTDIFSPNLRGSFASQLRTNYRMRAGAVGGAVTLNNLDITSPTNNVSNNPNLYFSRNSTQNIVNTGLNQCLNYTSAVNGAPINLANCISTTPRWNINSNGQIVSQRDPNFCLAVNGNATTDGTALVLNTCNNIPGQKWRLDYSTV